MIAITIDATQVTTALGALDKNLLDLSPAFRQVGELAMQDGRDSIISQGGAFGDGWADMSPLTHVVATALYGRGRDPRTLLQNTRGLIDSLQPDGPESIFEVQPLSAEFGTRYTSERTGFAVAKYQQEGTSQTFRVLQGAGFAPIGIPGREFFGWRQERRQNYEDIFAAHFVKGL